MSETISGINIGLDYN